MLLKYSYQGKVFIFIYVLITPYITFQILERADFKSFILLLQVHMLMGLNKTRVSGGFFSLQDLLLKINSKGTHSSLPVVNYFSTIC